VLDPRKALFLRGRDQFTIAQETARRIMEVRGDSYDYWTQEWQRTAGSSQIGGTVKRPEARGGPSFLRLGAIRSSPE
jgi:hypothetical protein